MQPEALPPRGDEILSQGSPEKGEKAEEGEILSNQVDLKVVTVDKPELCLEGSGENDKSKALVVVSEDTQKEKSEKKSYGGEISHKSDRLSS